VKFGKQRAEFESAIRLVNVQTGDEFSTANGSAVLLASKSTGVWRSPLVFEVHRMAQNEYPEHTTVGHQLMLNLGGPVRLGWLEEGRRREAILRPGDLCIQSDGDSNAPRWADEMMFATASIAPGAFEELLGEYTPHREDLFPKKHCAPDPTAVAFARSLAAELAAPTEPLYAEALSTAFVLHLLATHAHRIGKKPRAPRGKLSGKQLRLVLDFARENLRSVTVRSMATVAGYSSFQFSRLFKASTGFSPHQFVLSLRLERAYRLLRDVNAQLADVALATGFYDQAHLTNAFRRAFGVTPSAFATRASHRSTPQR
jgi:AraC family transcriptional regulator